MPKTVTVGVRLSPEAKAALRRVAEQKGRTLAGHLRIVLEAAAKRLEKGK